MVHVSSLPVKKIYIDTRNRVNAMSTSASNFTWELPRTVYFPDPTICVLSDICIPHNW